ncbi:MAG TPA: HAD family hydrolase [Azospirillaceae bacterium]|nr:HAD family hydrolase [Azospirillaceae bacterium]
MRYLALATDYDGTLAHDGRVTAATREAMARLKASGRRLILVTGRELPDLATVYDDFTDFDLIVAENGALLHVPATGEEVPLAPPPDPGFVQRLKACGATPLSVGRAIVATREPYDREVREVIRDLGLDLEITYNKGAVMVLPPGIDKASGLTSALARMGLAAETVVAVGDAENDLAFMERCGVAVAVANALPAVKQACDLVTRGVRGDGVAELIDRLIADDLADARPR